jgi:hypothetical protein
MNSVVLSLTIHSRDGDLSASQDVQTNPLYSFLLGSRPAVTMHLPQKLHLGVGDAGIIGRRVSVMAGSMQEPLTLAEGIIGWN